MDLLPLNILWAGPEKAAEVDNSVRLLTDSTAVKAKVMVNDRTIEESE